MKTLTTLALLIVALAVLPLLAQAQSQEPRAVVYIDHFYLGLYPAGGPLVAQAQGAVVSVPLRFGKVRVYGAINFSNRSQWNINLGGLELSYLFNAKARTFFWRTNIGTAFSYDALGGETKMGILYGAVNLFVYVGRNVGLELVAGPALGYYQNKTHGKGTAGGMIARAGIKLPL